MCFHTGVMWILSPITYIRSTARKKVFQSSHRHLTIVLRQNCERILYIQVF